MSAAQIRVRRESNPAKDDSYTDILQVHFNYCKKTRNCMTGHSHPQLIKYW